MFSNTGAHGEHSWIGYNLFEKEYVAVLTRKPGSARTALFLRLQSRANTIVPLMVKTLQQN